MPSLDLLTILLAIKLAINPSTNQAINDAGVSKIPILYVHLMNGLYDAKMDSASVGFDRVGRCANRSAGQGSFVNSCSRHAVPAV